MSLSVCGPSQGLFRYYEGSSLLSARFVAHLLHEDQFQVFAIIAARDPGAPLPVWARVC